MAEEVDFLGSVLSWMSEGERAICRELTFHFLSLFREWSSEGHNGVGLICFVGYLHPFSAIGLWPGSMSATAVHEAKASAC